MSSGSNPHNKRYFVEGYGKSWFVVSRNNKTVAKCPSKQWASTIAKLLIEDRERKEHYAESVEIPEGELVRE